VPRLAKKLQTALDITASKTKIIAFNTNQKQNNTFHIGKQNIEIVKQYKYLGVIIDNHFISNVKLGIKTSKIQESLHKDPRVHINRSCAMKAAAIQRDIGIPAIHSPDVKENVP